MINYQKIHADCHAAGLNAGVAVTPTPMLVGTAKSLLSNEIDYTKPTYRVDDGPCGFAYINIYPGNSKLANAYKKLGLARKAYGGGVTVNVYEFGQSYERKMAYARAYAEKLRELTGEARIYPDGRLD